MADRGLQATPTTTDTGETTGLPARQAASEAPAADPAESLARRVVIEHVWPTIDGGRFAVKRTVGETVDVRADIIADGHDVVTAVVRDRHSETGGAWRETPMVEVAAGTDEWSARFEVDALG